MTDKQRSATGRKLGNWRPRGPSQREGRPREGSVGHIEPSDDGAGSVVPARAGTESLKNGQDNQGRTFHRSHSFDTQLFGDIEQSEFPRIGRYRLLQQIGEGGMGVVWMAEQEEPVRRRVALKLIKTGLDTKEVITRFKVERQALAMMNHHHIAKVFDAGTHDGRPYFVMELVRGVPFNKYCDEKRLSLKERLILFIAVCRAVQHAHQRGIIHRDLNPSNVLVCDNEGKPIPKVIDFGLAKALQHQNQLSDKTVFTEFGRVLGTLQYMSPEQAETDVLDVDTRTDTYSLGVMLFELLTGGTPIHKTTARTVAREDLLKRIRENDPPRPSSRLNQSSTALKKISQQRRIDPQRLRQILKGDLDWIVMKALERDRSRRYSTADGLADDLERYLNDEPVAAKPPSATYKLRKLLVRHRKAFGVAIITSVLLLAGISVIIWQVIRATREAKRAEQNLYVARMSLAQQAWDAGNIVRARSLLEAWPPASAQSDLRGFDWHLLWQLTHNEQSNFSLGTAACAVALSPDESLVAFAGKNETVTVYSTVDHTPVSVFEGHEAEVSCLAFSQDGKFLASASYDKTVRVWDLASKECTVLRGHDDVVNAVVFHPNKKHVASASRDHLVILWDFHARKVLKKLFGHRDHANCLALSADGQWLISGSRDQTARVWNLATRQEAFTFNDHGAAVTAVTVSNGGRVATAALDGVIRIWKVSDPSESMPLYGHVGGVYGMAFSRDGRRLVSGGEDSLIKLWNLASWRCEKTIRGHLKSIPALSLANNGRIFSAGYDAIRHWNLNENKNPTTIKIPAVSQQSGSILSDNFRLQDRASSVTRVEVSHDKRVVAVSNSSGVLALWDTANRMFSDQARAHRTGINDIAFNADSTMLATGSDDGVLRLWKTECLSLANESRHPYAISSVFFLNDGKVLTAGPTAEIIVRDAQTMRQLARFRAHTTTLRTATPSNNGKLYATGTNDGTIRIWSGSELKILQELQGHEDVSNIAFGAQDRLLAVGFRDGYVTIWDWAKGRKLMSTRADIKHLRALVFSPDNRLLITGGKYGTLKFWNTATLEQQTCLASHSRSVRCVQFSRDGRMLLSGGDDGKVVIWEIDP